mmetsp:Transcript_37706/g.27789  ORF Transcript_37706/g.27789 Transcript_37706/m.27789 type:complete len:85 (+) Transcript_37706:456-710(+)
MRSSVEDLSDALEGFLAGSVPDLKFEGAEFDLHDEGAEFDADCDFVVLHELVVGHAVHQARLPHPRIAYHDHLEQEVLLQSSQP